MPMQQLIYVSKVARQVRFSDAEQIAEQASARNRFADLTGLLVYTPSHFLQVLEGPSDTLNATFERIKRDERHSEVRVIDKREINEREFGQWAMTARVLPAGTSAAVLDMLDRTRALRILRSSE